ncbi:MAG: NTPase [Thaumarchaeota archaeon]|nr:NTPase [Nitrososphaerota archaeon]
MKIFLTGFPRSGKSTVLMKTVELLKTKGLKVGGVVTPEIVESGRRVGFYVKDIYSGETEVFASISFKFGPRLGKYGVNISAFNEVAIKAIDFAVDNCNIICVDEIGKMEFFSEKFKNKINSLMLLSKPLVAVLHRDFVNQFKRYGEVIEVTPTNREKLPEELVNRIVSFFSKLQ